MSFLTQIIVNKTEAARRGFSDAYAWHSTLWKSFQKQDERKFLFRIDDAVMHFKILVLSASPPENQVWGQWQSKAIGPSFLEYSNYQFQLKANPTMRRVKDRRRLGIYNEKKLDEWMQHKALQHGFVIKENSLSIGAPLDETFIRQHKFGKHVSVDFQGFLQVTDKSIFKNTFTNGIGSAKSFGYGLLMLQPIRN